MKRKIAFSMALSAALLGITACNAEINIKPDVEAIVVPENNPATATGNESSNENDTLGQNDDNSDNSDADAEKIWYVVSRTEYDSDGNKTSYSEYDEGGRALKTIEYDTDGTVIYSMEEEYDEEGNSIKYISYGPNNQLWSKYETVFDDSGYELYRLEEYYRSDGSRSTWNEVKEDENDPNKLINTYYTGDKTLSYWIELELDSNGSVVKGSHYSSDGKLTCVEEYKKGKAFRITYYYDGAVESVSDLDEKGREIAYTQYDQNGMIEYWSSTEYEDNGNISQRYSNGGYNMYCDEAGNVICFETTDENGKVKFTETSEYDENDELIYRTTIDYEGNITVNVDNHKNADGTLDICSYDTEGACTSKVVLEYDENGRMAVRTTLYYDNSSDYITYEYDEYGNCVANELYSIDHTMFSRTEYEYASYEK